MGKKLWKPGNMLYPLPVVLVSTGSAAGEKNMFTVAWTGTICSDPPMVSISVRPQRYSYSMIKETGEFVINLTTEKLVFATDFCGVKSGKDVDKFKELKLTPQKANQVGAPLIQESPLNLECKVKDIISLGTHDMFIAQVVCVHADEQYMDENDRFCLNDSGLIVYSHGEYMTLGRSLGKFGFSVKR